MHDADEQRWEAISRTCTHWTVGIQAMRDALNDLTWLCERIVDGENISTALLAEAVADAKEALR